MKRIIRGIKRISIIPRSNKISPRTAWDINEDHRSSDGLVGASLVGHFSSSPRRVVILDAYPLFSPSVIRCLIETSESERTSVRIYMHVRVYHLYVCVCVYVCITSRAFIPFLPLSSSARHPMPKGFRSICDCPLARFSLFSRHPWLPIPRFRFFRIDRGSSTSAR